MTGTGNGMNGDVLYGTPTTKLPHRHQSAKSEPVRPDSDRRPPHVRPSRDSRRPCAAEVEFFAASADDRRRARLELAVRDRNDELRDLRQTMESNETALLRSLDDERRRWSAERLLLQAELLSARRHRRSASAFRSPSTDQAPLTDRVVVVEPSQRPPASETVATVPSPVDSVDAEKSHRRRTGNRDIATSPETSYPVEVGSGSRMSSETGKVDSETGRRSSATRVDDDVVADRLRLELELCRRELADERRRWADEKRVVVEYQLRLQTYCRQLADRNQLLEERLRTMSIELGRSGESSGYGSDSAALVVQFLDDSGLLTSTL